MSTSVLGQLQWLVYCLWVLAEIAIAATDLAEIIGSAVALNLLFNIPLYAGVIITAVDVLFIIAFGMKNFRFLEVGFSSSTLVPLVLQDCQCCTYTRCRPARGSWQEDIGFLPISASYRHVPCTLLTRANIEPRVI